MNAYCDMLNSSYRGNYTMIMTFDKNNSMQSLAAFLVVRPEYGWLGYGWESDMRMWNDVFLYDVGEPTEYVCREFGGVYSREWSYGDVSLDCNKWTAAVPHK